MKALFVLLSIIAISWAITCLFLKLIALCFGLSLTLVMATGVWLGLFLLKIVLMDWNKSKS